MVAIRRRRQARGGTAKPKTREDPLVRSKDITPTYQALRGIHRFYGDIQAAVEIL